MIIRKAEMRELGTIMPLFDRARTFMRATGNPNQWTHYPTEEILRNDIGRGECYVMESAAGIEGVFVMSFGKDKDYELPEAGFAPGEYASLHRLASAGHRQGIFRAMLCYAQERADCLRADTHAENHIIQTLLEKNGFCRRGELTREGERFPTYEWVRETENSTIED